MTDGIPVDDRDLQEPEGPPDAAADDPWRPWKALAAVITAVVVYLLGQQVLELTPAVIVALNIVLVGVTTFFVKNPKL